MGCGGYETDAPTCQEVADDLFVSMAASFLGRLNPVTGQGVVCICVCVFR